MKDKDQGKDRDATVETDVNTDENVDSDPVLIRLHKLIEIAEQSDLAMVRLRDGEIEIEISRGAIQQTVAAPTFSEASTQVLVTESEAGVDMILSPMPARFYRSPAPDEPPFIEQGDSVAAGEPLATLEVMKTYNDVEAPFDCEILEILVEDGQAVEYNQPLFRVRQN